MISSPGKYAWATYASGGIGPPYHYQWYQKYCNLPPGPPDSVGGDSWKLTLFVTEIPPHGGCFWLIVSVWDEGGVRADSADHCLVYLSQMEGMQALAGVGVLDAAGTCRPLPAEKVDRQRLYNELRRAGVAIRFCEASASELD